MMDARTFGTVSALPLPTSAPSATGTWRSRYRQRHRRACGRRRPTSMSCRCRTLPQCARSANFRCFASPLMVNDCADSGLRNKVSTCFAIGSFGPCMGRYNSAMREPSSWEEVLRYSKYVSTAVSKWNCGNGTEVSREEGHYSCVQGLGDQQEQIRESKLNSNGSCN